MSRDNLRRKTALVIRNQYGEYLSRKDMVTGKILWDRHLSNAWKTRKREKAGKMVQKLGGEICLFNPIIWEVRAL